MFHLVETYSSFLVLKQMELVLFQDKPYRTNSQVVLNKLFLQTLQLPLPVTVCTVSKEIQEAIEKELPQISLTFIYNPTTDSNDLLLNGENVEKQIRMPDVAANVSKIAALKSVRKKLVDEQRKIGENGGIVMDGRDIGSVVFPDAELKLFVTASPEIRAERRLKELREKGIEISLDEVIANLMERDLLDSTREESPLIQTDDAIVIDTTHCTREEQLDLASQYAEEAMCKA
jgi:cytidylate kinase